MSSPFARLGAGSPAAADAPRSHTPGSDASTGPIMAIYGVDSNLKILAALVLALPATVIITGDIDCVVLLTLAVYTLELAEGGARDAKK